MKSRQDKMGQGKFLFRAHRLLGWIGGYTTRETGRLAAGVILGATLCGIVFGGAPVFAARAPYLDTTSRQQAVTPPPVFAPQTGLVEGPAIERIEAHASGAIRIDGRGTPNAIIFVEIDGRIAASPAVNASGRWQTQIAVPLSPVEFVIKTSARGTWAWLSRWRS